MARNNSIIGILINIKKAGNGDMQAIGALKNIQKTVGEATAIFGTLVAAGYAINKAFEAMSGLFVDYAKDVRGLSQAFGLTSEEASRLIQLTDDLGISQETLTKSLKKMSSNGIAPSLSGLQMLSEKFNTVQGPAAQAKFLVDNFGKSGLEMAAAMRLGANGLQSMNDAVEESLVLTREAMNEARAYEMEVDALNDTWTAFKITIGQGVVPVLNDLLIHQMAQANVNKRLIEEGKGVILWSQEYQEAVLAEAAALKVKQEAQIEAENGERDLTDADLELIDAERELQRVSTALAAGLAGEYADAYTTYREKLEQADQAVWDAQVAMSELRAAGKLTADMQDDYNRKIDEGIQSQHDAAAALERTTSKMIYQAAVAGLDARSALKLARAMGLISEADYAIVDAVEVLKERRDEEIKSTGNAEKANADYLQELEHMTNLIKGLPPETIITVITNFIENGSPPEIPSDTGGGGGGGSGTCFLAGTLVATPNGPRAIETLRVGDPIVSMETERGERVIARVARVYHHPAEAIRGYLVINAFLRVTSDHPLYSSAGWKPAGDLTIGEPLRAWDGWLFVTSIERVDTPVPTYNLETDHATHNYFADGVLVHNKETEGYASGGVASGSSSGHWELLHGTEVVTTQSQFGDIMRAFSSVANGALGGGMNLSGATIQVSYSGNDFAGLLQSIQDSAGRIA